VRWATRGGADACWQHCQICMSPQTTWPPPGTTLPHLPARAIHFQPVQAEARQPAAQQGRQQRRRGRRPRCRCKVRQRKLRGAPLAGPHRHIRARMVKRPHATAAAVGASAVRAVADAVPRAAAGVAHPGQQAGAAAAACHAPAGRWGGQCVGKGDAVACRIKGISWSHHGIWLCTRRCLEMLPCNAVAWLPHSLQCQGPCKLATRPTCGCGRRCGSQARQVQGGEGRGMAAHRLQPCLGHACSQDTSGPGARLECGISHAGIPMQPPIKRCRRGLTGPSCKAAAGSQLAV
jgi:hypothetical protein